MQGRGLPTGPPALRRLTNAEIGTRNAEVKTLIVPHSEFPVPSSRRSVRLAARTLAFQAGNGGSIPPRTMVRSQETGVRRQGSGVSNAEHRPVAQRLSAPLTTGRMKVRILPGRLADTDGAQVLAAASPALTRVVRVQV